MSERRTMAQALVEFLARQYTERDGVRHRLFAGCFGIFGHGNLAGLGQALMQHQDMLRYHQCRNEQGMVHTAAAYARMTNRLSTFACTTSIGPGATNMLTGAAGATINRLPVLLLPGDTFATRPAPPVLQQLEVPWAGDVSVNDCFRPVSRYFDRVSRPEQLVDAALHAVRVLTDPVETGAVTLALPQDVQAEAYDALAAFCAATWVPVAETQAGKGALRYDHPCAVGAVGATGTTAANALAAEADVVIGIGTRYSDFTTASRTLFADPGVRFVNVNVAAFDAAKHAGLAVVADARETLMALGKRWRAIAYRRSTGSGPRRSPPNGRP